MGYRDLPISLVGLTRGCAPVMWVSNCSASSGKKGAYGCWVLSSNLRLRRNFVDSWFMEQRTHYHRIVKESMEVNHPVNIFFYGFCERLMATPPRPSCGNIKCRSNWYFVDKIFRCSRQRASMWLARFGNASLSASDEVSFGFIRLWLCASSGNLQNCHKDWPFYQLYLSCHSLSHPNFDMQLTLMKHYIYSNYCCQWNSIRS